MELKALGVSKRYLRAVGGANYFEAVKNTDITLAGGSVSVLMGRSGSGKTTLLTMLAGLLTPSTGQVLLDGQDIYALGDRQLSKLRAARMAVIPQGTSAISSLSVMENILLPASLAGKQAPEAEAKSLMEQLDIAKLKDALPARLSGGELRRMAIVRALCLKPDLIFADEPTADLDDENSLLTLQLLKNAAQAGAAVLIVSHESEAASYADMLYRMNDGTLAREASAT